MSAASDRLSRLYRTQDRARMTAFDDNLRGADLRRGILRAWNSGAYTADVQLDGSLHQLLTGIPVARDIASAEMVTGRKVCVALFNHSDPADAAVLAVWT